MASSVHGYRDDHQHHADSRCKKADPPPSRLPLLLAEVVLEGRYSPHRQVGESLGLASSRIAAEELARIRDVLV